MARWIDSGAVVVDLGAQRGNFAHRVIRRFNARCYAVEASPYLFREIPPHERLRAFNFAVCSVDGDVPFYVSEKADSSSLIPRTDRRVIETLTVPGRRLETFLRENGMDSVDLLKVDIEGAEMLLLDSTGDETLKRIGQISIEFHHPQGLVSTADVQRFQRRLARLGFWMIQFSWNTWDCLFVNQARCPITVFQWLYCHYVVRATRGWRKRTSVQAALRAGKPHT